MLKYIKYLLASLFVIALLDGCGHAKPKVNDKIQEAKKQQKRVKKVKDTTLETIYVDTKAKYTGRIAQNIKDECKIDSQVIEWIKRYSAKNHIKIIVGGKPKATDKVLKISITDAMSQRMGPMGHYKYVVISGKLYKGKKLISSFKAGRQSGGGYFGGYRNSCSVLGSCAKTLGKDTSKWLKNPKNNALYGDIHLIK